MDLDRYKEDLEALIAKGDQLLNAMWLECFPDERREQLKDSLGDKAEDFIGGLPSFRDEYQLWYSEARTLIQQMLPDRLTDFTRHYEKPTSRGEMTRETYTIEDYLQVLALTRRKSGTNVVDFSAAIPRFQQQLSIVKAVQGRFQSSLFDIRQLAQADLFDSELDAAKELAKNRFSRAAGAVAGVVLEHHLKEVCESHGVTIQKKSPHISDLNDALKKADVIDTPQWRSMQYLADLRNLCDHDKESEPTAEQVGELISGVEKVTKTLF